MRGVCACATAGKPNSKSFGSFAVVIGRLKKHVTIPAATLLTNKQEKSQFFDPKQTISILQEDMS